MIKWINHQWVWTLTRCQMLISFHYFKHHLLIFRIYQKFYYIFGDIMQTIGLDFNINNPDKLVNQVINAF